MKKANTIGNKHSKLYIAYIIGTIILIFLTFFSIKQTVMGREQTKRLEMVRSVDVEEQRYIKSMKMKLSDYGFVNCGITMTKMVEGDNKFYYAVQIHHKNLDDLGINQKDAIFYSLKDLPNEIESILKADEMVTEVYFIYEII